MAGHNPRLEYAARGIMAGVGLGVILSWILPVPMAQAMLLGGLCGCLAALTIHARRDK